MSLLHGQVLRQRRSDGLCRVFRRGSQESIESLASQAWQTVAWMEHSLTIVPPYTATDVDLILAAIEGAEP